MGKQGSSLGPKPIGKFTARVNNSMLDGFMDVEVDIFSDEGPFVIHEDTRQAWDGFYTVTHKRTRMAAGQEMKFRTAKRFMKALIAAKLDWDFDDKDKVPHETHEKAVEIRKKFGCD